MHLEAVPRIAIDFGTTRTKVACFDDARGEPRLIELGREIRAVIPSVFYLPRGGEGNRLVGDDAVERVDDDPEGIVIGLKREIHKLGRKRCGPGRPTPTRVELASDLFAYIRQRCEEEVFHRQQLSTCTLTVPVKFDEQQRNCIRQAAQLGGFSEICLIEEPVSAAMAWLGRTGARTSEAVVVCDVGGGTTDFALLQWSNGRFRPHPEVSTGGFRLGGNDVDEEIWTQVLDNTNDAEELQRCSSAFRVRLRAIKEWLSRGRHHARVTLGARTIDVPEDVARQCINEFVQRVRDELRRFLDLTRAATGKETTPLLLVGGASRLPGLKEAAEELVPDAVFMWSESDFATVLGAVGRQEESSASRTKIGAPAATAYREAVESVFADGVVTASEVDHLRRRQDALGIRDELAAEIETAILGQPKSEITTRDEHVVVRCSCGQRLRAPRDAIGKKGKCSKCGKVVQIVSSQGGAEAADTRPLDAGLLRELIGDGYSKRAFERASQAMISAPTVETFELWAECAHAVSDVAAVLDMARVIHRERGGDVWSSSCLSLALAECGRYDEAKALLTARPCDDKTALFAWVYGRLFAVDTDDPEYVALLDSALSMRPDNPELAAQHAVRLLDSDWLEAKRVIQLAKTRNPVSVSCRYVSILVQSGEAADRRAQEEVLEDVRLLEQVAPNHALTRVGRAIHLLAEGDYTAAKADLARALEDGRIRQSAELASFVLFLRATASLSLEDVESARQDVNESVRRCADSPALEMQGQFLLQDGDHEGAFACFDQVLSKTPLSSGALIGRGWCKASQGSWDGAQTDFERAWAADSSQVEAVSGAMLSVIWKHMAAADLEENRVMVAPDIPEAKLTGAIAAYGAAMQSVTPDEVLCLYDDTVFGSAGDGFCISIRDFAWHSLGDQAWRLELSAIESVQAIEGGFFDELLGNRSFIINGSHKVPITMAEDKTKVASVFASALAELGELARRMPMPSDQRSGEC